MLRELPFGARISDSFVKMLKWETAKANEELPGALPCLCIEETQHYETCSSRQSHTARITLEENPEVPFINRLLPVKSPPVKLIKQRVWRLAFDNRKHPPEATFEIDGLELHISQKAQVELKGATILVVNDKVVVKHENT